MSEHEIQENIEHAHHQGEKGIGLTTAIWAVLLAAATLLGHRAHTEEIILQSKNVDDWNFYQAKHTRAYEFAARAKQEALLPNGRDAAIEDLQSSIEEECGAPAEKGCTSPGLRKSRILQQLAADIKSEPATSGAKEGEASTEPKSASGLVQQPGKDEKGAHKEPAKTEKSNKESQGAKEGAVQIQERAREREKEILLAERRANFYDGGELFIDVSIVLCSIALLSGAKSYWKVSFITMAIGIVTVLWGLLLR